MNYYNPYMLYPYATATTPVTRSLFSGLFNRGSFSFSNLLSGAQKTLNFINQTIPVVKQVSPMMKNAKTMFRVMNEFKKVDTPNQSNKNDKKGISKNIEKPIIEKKETNNGPTFFV